MPSDNLKADLKKAGQGLAYPSESDTPVNVVQFGKGGSAKDQIVTVAAGRKVVEVPTEFFFDQLKDSDDAERFALLRRILEPVADFTVFRVGDGEMTVDIFLIGTDQAGQWVGVHTVSVET